MHETRAVERRTWNLMHSSLLMLVLMFYICFCFLLQLVQAVCKIKFGRRYLQSNSCS